MNKNNENISSTFNSDYSDYTKNLNLLHHTIAEKLNINLDEPCQNERIEALFELLKKHLYKSDVKAYLYQKIIECCNKLMDLFTKNIDEIENLKNSDEIHLFKIQQLESIHFKNIHQIGHLEEKLLSYKQLIAANEHQFSKNQPISDEHTKKLLEIDEKCFSYWLKVLDINCELRNTIIGYNNRLASYKTSHAYINYYIFVDKKINETFKKIQSMKKEGIEEYYEIIRNYSLPHEKHLNFQLFLQKKIESKLHDALELKSSFGTLLESHYTQIQTNMNVIKEEYKNHQFEIIAIINYYKEFLLKKQIIFSEDALQIINYLKNRYIEKINHIFYLADEYSETSLNESSYLTPDDKDVLMHFVSEEFQASLNKIKEKYAKILIPLLDNFSQIEGYVESKYAIDPQLLEEKYVELTKIKNTNLTAIIEKFKKERSKVDDIFENKKFLITDSKKLNIKQANELVATLKNDCESICSDLLKFNQRFWSKINAEFNSEARRYLIKLHYEYAPWVHIWNSGNKSWFHEYLIMNINQEYLRSVGASLKDYSPESDLFISASSALFEYNEYAREIYKNRDLIEYEHLIKLNTVPKLDHEKILSIANEKLESLKNMQEKYWNTYNTFKAFLSK